MPSSSDCWGIEVGSNALKAIRLQKSGQGVKVVDFVVQPFAKVLSTPDTDADEIIKLALDEFATRHPIGRSTVMISVPGHKAFARFAKLPPVEPKKIPDIVKFEAVQQIPFPIEEVDWDYQTFTHPDSPDVEVGIFAITKDRILPWLSNFEMAHVPVNGVTLSPVAIYNAMAYDLDLNEQSPGTVLMDVGTNATDLIITDQGRIWLRTIPIGGHHFTEALVEGFQLNYSKAEKLKREATTSKYSKQILQSMRPVFVDLAQEISKSLGYYKSMNRDSEIKVILGMGSTFRLPGMQKFLKQQLQMEVIQLNAFKKLNVEGVQESNNFQENTLTLAPAYGLALQGLELERVSCNILPSYLIKQHIWKTKTKWFGAAAAVVIGAAGIMIGRGVLDDQLYASSHKEYKPGIDSVIREAQAKEKEMAELNTTSDPQVQIENLRAIMDFRGVWPSFLEDLDAAVAAYVGSDDEAQKLLLEGDPKKIEKQLPERAKRRLISIIEITPSYTFEGPKGQTYDQIWKSKAGSNAAPAPEKAKPVTGRPLTDEEIRQQAAESNASQPAVIGGVGVPTLTIEIKARTTLADPTPRLLSTFVATLNSRGQSPDRPYVAVAGLSEAAIKVVVLPGQQANKRPQPGASTTKYQWQQDVETREVLGMLPVDPFAKEAVTDDFEFKIAVKLTLKNPRDVRKVGDVAPAGADAKPAAADKSKDGAGDKESNK